MSEALKIHHHLGELVMKPNCELDGLRLKEMIRSTLDLYAENDSISADVVHDIAKQAFGSNYQTPGYFLKMYRLRSDLTQKQLADRVGIRQHHLSEIENNKRGLGKSNAKKIANALGCTYQKLL
jgi:DNA-binding XRE family transcriptional regulator